MWATYVLDKQIKHLLQPQNKLNLNDFLRKIAESYLRDPT
jgi:hypothetical protein